MNTAGARFTILCAPLAHSLRPSHSEQQGDRPENRFIKDLLVNVLSTPYFYYSYTGNLTHTRQRLFSRPNDAKVLFKVSSGKYR